MRTEFLRLKACQDIVADVVRNLARLPEVAEVARQMDEWNLVVRLTPPEVPDTRVWLHKQFDDIQGVHAVDRFASSSRATPIRPTVRAR